MQFFQSLKKQPPKVRPPQAEHYHVHYYPLPIPLMAWRAPDKRDLDKYYRYYYILILNVM